ncbi:MAG: RNA methyltransferase, partial [Spirochaetales bacterium]|nr:RNA methyltransferase [Spirochaetales bacterium]
SIPSSPDFPSLNLSHAVQVITYELYLADLSGRAGTAHQPVDARELAASVARIVNSLENLGFHTQAGPQGMRTFLSDILGRAMLSHAEAVRLKGLFEKIEGMHGRGE